MTEFLRVSSVLNKVNVSLKINETTNSVHYDIMQFQPSLELDYSSTMGISCTNEDYQKKVSSFLDYAREKNSALVVTPEASIPIENLMEIISTRAKWPEEQNLWCLCSEGVSVDKFNQIKEEMDEKENIKLIVDDAITYNHHINAIWYLFRISSEELCIVIQLKQRAMSDRNLTSEGVDLSLGSKVYIFDLNGGNNTRNVLLSLICADAIQLPVSDIITSLRHTHPIIINPQLNPKPFSSHFVTFRKSYFSNTTISKQRLITVNWGVGTRIGSAINISESGSSYYNYLSVNGKRHVEAISKDRDIYNHRTECQKMGMSNFCDDKYNIWNIGNNECVIHYYIRKEDVFDCNPDFGLQFDPKVKKKNCYTYETDKWTSSISLNCIEPSIDFVFSDLASEYKEYLPFNYEKCANKTCTDKCDWLCNDYLFGVCFGNLLRGEIESTNEISNRTTVMLNKDSLRNTREKRKKFIKLIKLLSKNKIPKALCMFVDNHKLEIDLEAAKSGSDRIYNISIKNDNDEYPNWKYKKGLFIIMDTDEVSEVEIFYDKVKAMINEEYRDQIVIYYRDDIKYIYYSKPFENTKIGKSNTSFSSKTSSFLEGSMSYD